MAGGVGASRRHVLRFGAGLTIGGATGLLAPRLRAATAAEEPAGQPVKIVIIAGDNSNILQALIDQQGYLEAFGLKPSVLAVSDGSKATAALINGSADICTGSGVSQVLTAIERGGALKIVAGTAVLPLTAIYSSRPEIRSAKDLIGRTVGVGAPGALLHQLVVALMIKKGLDYKQVKFVNVGSSSDVVRAISAGTVDAGVGDYQLYDQQAKFHMHALTDGDLWSQLPEYTNQGAYTSNDSLTKKRDVLVRTLAAYAKAFQFLESPQSLDAYLKARATAVSKNVPGAGETQWKFYQKYRPYSTTLTISEKRLRYMQDLNVLLGVQKKALPSDEVADFTLARDALKLLS